MRCYSCCSAASYDIKGFFRSIKNAYKSKLYRDIVHVEYPTESGTGDLFFFDYGCLVTWGLSKEEEKQFLREVKPYEHKPLESIEYEVVAYRIGDETKLENDELILANRDILTLLAVSHGLAQSVKLETFEEAIQKTYNATKHIPEDLSKWGKISLSRKEIRRMMGSLFIERSNVNLHFEILDTPEFFWEHPELEATYKEISNEMDITTRVEVLNQRLDVVHELFEMLGNELNHQHSSRLEWTIIILIVIEVLLTVQRDIIHWF